DVAVVVHAQQALQPGFGVSTEPPHLCSRLQHVGPYPLVDGVQTKNPLATLTRERLYFPEANGQFGLMARNDVDQIMAQFLQLNLRVWLMLDGVASQDTQLGHVAAADLVKNFFLTVDMMVERPATQADGFAYVVDAHRVIAALCKQQCSHADNAVP